MSDVGVTKVQGGGVLVQLGTRWGRNVVFAPDADKAKREEGSFGFGDIREGHHEVYNNFQQILRTQS